MMRRGGSHRNARGYAELENRSSLSATPTDVDFGFRVSRRPWRAAHGGSWFLSENYARAGLRAGDHPAKRGLGRGFRVARRQT